MARPRKWRKVCCLPDYSVFGPLNFEVNMQDAVKMTIDEYEAIRLIDLEGFTQEECAERMNVARTTIQGMYIEARRKMALALVEGKVLTIEGGAYRLCDGMGASCGRGCRRQLRQGAGHSGKNNPIWEQQIANNGGKIMKIAIPVDDKSMSSTVCISFGRAPYFLIHDIENKTSLFLENTAAASAGGAGIKAAQLLVDSNVSAVLTPRCGENAAGVLQMAGIKLYKTDSTLIADSIDSFIKNKLPELNEIHAGLHNGR